jgi:hypothetical protein
VDFGGLVPVRVGGDAAAQMVTEDVFCDLQDRDGLSVVSRCHAQ